MKVAAVIPAHLRPPRAHLPQDRPLRPPQPSKAVALTTWMTIFRFNQIFKRFRTVAGIEYAWHAMYLVAYDVA
jgi:hypothetical protein